MLGRYSDLVFGRKSKAGQDDANIVDADPAGQESDPQGKKGYATPSRKEAEKARREARHIPADPKAAKKARKERTRLERTQARAGIMAGDEKYLPPRDQGPVKAFTRDFIDGRRRLSEFFVFIAVGILVAGFVNNPQIQEWISILWFSITFMVIAEMTWTLVSLQKALKKQWPDKADRKGTTFYGAIRALQIRKLRVPPPRVRPGGARIDKA